MDQHIRGKQAYLLYHSGSFDVLTPGDHVVCAVTGRAIHLSQLSYWCAHRQEAYVNAEISLKRSKEPGGPS